MKVLIDATGITRKKAGVGVYARNLIDKLIAAGTMHLFLVVQDDDPDFDYADLAHVTVLKMPARWLRMIPLRVLFEQTVLPLLIRKYRVDVVHSLHYSFPLFRFGVPAAVTIHDMTSLLMPEVHKGLRMRYHSFFIRRACRWADGLIFVSRSAQSDFIARVGTPRGVSAVVYHGIGKTFQPAHDEAAIARVRDRYGLPSRYVLYIGTVEPRKNLERLVQALATVMPSDPDLSLVIAGMMGWHQEHLPRLIESLGLKSHVYFPGFIAEEDKAHLITGCTLFVYPSLYEGFGLPVLEALASAVPTITSNISSLPEVAGNAALLVDPKDTAALAGAMRAILSDPVLVSELCGKGPEQAKKFTWQRAAEETMAFYTALFASRS
jgi:glycosyltransferase involved in cell wall biosynthesis